MGLHLTNHRKKQGYSYDTPQTLIKPTFKGNCETYGKLKKYEKYLKRIQKDQNKSDIYLKATGYSEEGQSRYRAFKAATIDAKRNLLEEIKGSDIFSQTIIKDGEMNSDAILNRARGSIRYIKIISKKYDSKTRSAEVTVGLTKEALKKI